MNLIELAQNDFGEYDKGTLALSKKNYFKNFERAHKFYEGKQWEEETDMPQPVVNILEPIVNYKVASVAQNAMSIHFTPMEEDRESLEVSSKLNSHIQKVWEWTYMDTVLWDLILESAISGTSSIYSFFDEEKEEIKVEIKSGAEIIFGDEVEKDLEKMPFVILPSRQRVEELKKEARELKLPKELIESISSDDDDGKVLCLHRLFKEDGKVFARKSVRGFAFYEKKDLGLERYPLCLLTWGDVLGETRGQGEVLKLIPNQVEINKNMSRRATSVMTGAYPKLAYLTDSVESPESLLEVGSAIGLTGLNVQDINKAVGYLSPAQISPDAERFTTELVRVTRELAGASEVAFGGVNPENASGKAILAVMDASQIPLSRQVAKTRKFVEELARVWWNMYEVYFPNGLTVFYDKTEVSYDENGNLQKKKRQRREKLRKDALKKSRLTLRVDVTNKAPFSKFALEQTLEKFLLSKFITFEEYLDLLPKDAVASVLKSIR